MLAHPLMLLLVAGVDIPGLEGTPLEDILGTQPAREEAVLQNRRFSLGHELTLLLGGLPTDPFNKGLTATAGYTVHINDEWALELLQVTYSHNLDSNLKQEVLRFRQASFPAVRLVAASHLVFKPIYGKQAIFNTRVVHLEGYGQIGGVMVSRSDHPRLPRPGADLGVGVRLWVTDGVSMRLELGEILYAASRSEALGNIFFVRGGIALSTRGDR